MNTIRYMTGLLTFYLKGEISTEQNFLKLKIPNTILALIPLGSQKENVPVGQLATVATNFKLALGRFIIGILLVVAAFSSFGDRDAIVGAFVVLVIGVCILISSFLTELRIDTTAGKEYKIKFLIFEKSKAEQAETIIRGIIENRLNDTNNRQVAEAQTNAIVDAINGQK